METEPIAAADVQRIFLPTADGSPAVRACSGTTVHTSPFPRDVAPPWGSGPSLGEAGGPLDEDFAVDILRIIECQVLEAHHFPNFSAIAFHWMMCPEEASLGTKPVVARL